MIPFVDLAAQFSRLEKDIRAGMDAVLAHGRFIMGPEVAQLEEKLAAFAGAAHCVSCGSGTDALLMALMAKGVGPGDAILTTPFTFIATAEVVALLGATPVFVDIDPGTFNIDPDRLEAALAALPQKAPGLTPKGIIPVDLFGLPADYDRINAVARKHGLFVLEDAAQGFGGLYRGKRACALTDVAATSFFPAKPLGCYGDGGAVFTDDAALADLLRSIRVHGKGSHKYENARIGINGRLDTLQAAILLPKLAVFPEELEARQRVAARYAKGLAGLPDLRLPVAPQGLTSAWAQYSLLSPHKAAIQAALKEAGVPTAVYYPKPLHLQPAFAALGYKEGEMPVSEASSRDIFSLPMHPYLEDAAIDRICGVIAGAAG